MKQSNKKLYAVESSLTVCFNRCYQFCVKKFTHINMLGKMEAANNGSFTLYHKYTMCGKVTFLTSFSDENIFVFLMPL